jgi:hypothetical protein
MWSSRCRVLQAVRDTTHVQNDRPLTHDSSVGGIRNAACWAMLSIHRADVGQPRAFSALPPTAFAPSTALVRSLVLRLKQQCKREPESKPSLVATTDAGLSSAAQWQSPFRSVVFFHLRLIRHGGRPLEPDTTLHHLFIAVADVFLREFKRVVHVSTRGAVL